MNRPLGQCCGNCTAFNPAATAVDEADQTIRVIRKSFCDLDPALPYRGADDWCQQFIEAVLQEEPAGESAP